MRRTGRPAACWRGEVGQHDAPFLVSLLIAPDAGEQIRDKDLQRPGVMGGHRQLGAHLVAVIGSRSLNGLVRIYRVTCRQHIVVTQRNLEVGTITLKVV